jgi:large subunit ribosomal protein L21
MFAVIKTGGKQYRVAANDLLSVAKLPAAPGEIVTFPVLVLGGDKPQVGAPLVAGAAVAAEVVQQARGERVIAFKKRRRKNSRRTIGHRQDFTLVRITEILTDGKAPSKAKPKAEARPEKLKPEEKPAAEAKPAKPKAKAPEKKPGKPAPKGKGKK